MKAAKYREMSVDELNDQVDQLRTELFNMRVGNTTKELQNTAKIRGTKRDLARLLTVLNEKRKGATAA
ncbi:MAG: 50S ribosomal protein L29 [bacterium]|nr:50S ribosomal protein L29 [bacterium]